jgi:hypothetical protein
VLIANFTDMAKAKKPKKERSYTYDPKLKVNNLSFDDFVNLSVNKPLEEKKESKKK